MSTENLRKSGSATWVVCLMFVPVVYVATWPPIEMHFATSFTHSWSRVVYYTAAGEVRTWASTPEPVSPRWAEILFSPLHSMRHIEIRHNPVAYYWNWWAHRWSGLPSFP